MRGGKRAGAGRKRGSLNRKTRAIAEAAAEAGITPLEYMLQIMRDPSADVHLRAEMAKAAAPYIHPRLSVIEHGGKLAAPITITVLPGEFGL